MKTRVFMAQTGFDNKQMIFCGVKCKIMYFVYLLYILLWQ